MAMKQEMESEQMRPYHIRAFPRLGLTAQSPMMGLSTLWPFGEV